MCKILEELQIKYQMDSKQRESYMLQDKHGRFYGEGSLQFEPLGMGTTFLIKTISHRQKVRGQKP